MRTRSGNVPLGDVFKIVKGRKPVLKKFPSEGDLPYLIAKVIRGSAKAQFASTKDKNSVAVSGGETIIICDGSNSGEVFTGFEGILSSTMGKISKKVAINDDYLRIFLGNTFNTLNKAKTGAAIPHLDKEALYQIGISLPSLLEQERIVGLLTEALDSIGAAKINYQTNLKNSQILFEQELALLFSHINKSGSPKPLGQVCNIKSPLVDPRTPENRILRHVGGANIESQTGILQNLKTAEEEGLISGKFIFDKDVVLYSKIRPYLKKVARPNFRGLCSADIYPLSCNPEELERDYLFYLLLSPDFTAFAISGSGRAGMPKVNREHLFSYPCYLPKRTVQLAASRRLDQLFLKTRSLEEVYRQKLASLEDLKLSLLQEAFKGAF